MSLRQFELEPAGTRVSTRNAEGYFAMMRDFARAGGIWPAATAPPS